MCKKLYVCIVAINQVPFGLGQHGNFLTHPFLNCPINDHKIGKMNDFWPLYVTWTV